MALSQNDLEHLQDLLKRGLITADQANVKKIQMARVQVIKGSLSANVRKALNAAVKNGELGHWRKEGQKPEVYFHLSFDYLATAERSKCEHKSIKAVSGLMA